jgi:two-component system chemotaxis sensor kinase CheA
MDDPDFRRRLRETFQAEAREHLHAISHAAFALEKAAPAEHPALVERIFRETHTLKGASRMVGEIEAESLCHALEQQLSGLKQAGKQVPAPVVADLHDQIAEITRLLGLQAAPAAAPAAAPEKAAEPDAAAAVAAASTVRVPGARLDALLQRAEEMVSARLTGEQHVATLRSLSERGLAWKKELERVRPDIATLRRHVDNGGGSSPVAKELTALLHYLDWTHEFLREFHGDVAKLGKGVGSDQRRLGGMIEHLLEETKEVLMQPFSALLEMFPAFVREIAVRQGKDIELEIEGAKTEIDRRVLEEIKDALVHLVRNSIDHGIEAAAERRAKGKAERGRLVISVRGRSGGNVEIAVADDGRGINPGEVTASARRLGLLEENAPELSDNDALSLLFRSGFSTKAATTELSGRGLGLAIVREKAEHIGGTVSVESEPGRGTTFRLQLPLTLARFRGLFVAAQGQSFVVPASYVRRVLRLRAAEFRQVKNREVIEVEGSSVVVLRLADVLGLPQAIAKGGDGNATAFVLFVESARSRIALRVDDAPHEQEIVMKSLGPILRGARQYVGATLVAGGRIVPVLNVSNLLSAAIESGRGTRREAPLPARQADRRKRTILVAEDSITSRSLLKSILQAAGFEVRTAVDGADALTTLKFEPVDLLISDVQMPRMDGFELTAKIRADAALSTLPVILITSLASREDKARGVDAGANAYIVKSSFDQSDLLEAIGRLIP